MKFLKRAALILGAIALLTFVTRVVLHRSPLVLGVVHVLVPRLISTHELAENLHSGNTVLVRETIGALNERNSFSHTEQVLQHLSSADDLLWWNAAYYLGRAGRAESVPYLIKALCHTVNCCDAEIVGILRQLTGQDFGTDAARWRDWWFRQHATDLFNFDDHLGPRPRRAELAQLECTIVDFGIYEVPGARDPRGIDDINWAVDERLLLVTTSIPGTTGVCFGFRYVTGGDTAIGSYVPLHVVASSPAAAGRPPTNLPAVVSAYSPTLMGETGLAAFAFDDISEVVTGRWQLSLEYHSETVTGMSFTVVGLP